MLIKWIYLMNNIFQKLILSQSKNLLYTVKTCQGQIITKNFVFIEMFVKILKEYYKDKCKIRIKLNSQKSSETH